MRREKMYRYMECGLENVWLCNGYDIVETEYGEGIAIHNLEDLHKAIGLALVQNNPQLNGSEIRFLRKELDLSQVQLSNLLGVSENSLRGWENDRVEISEPAERLLRALYCEFVQGASHIRGIIEQLGQINRDIYEKGLKMKSGVNGWSTAA